MSKKYFALNLIVVLICMAVKSGAQLSLSPLFEDHMVIQQKKPFAISGKDKPGSNITIRFNDITRMAVAGTDSGWLALMPPIAPRSQPSTLVVFNGANTINIRDILVGDVWLCIGQSNMEWPLSKEAFFMEEKAHLDQPLIRLKNPVFAGKGIFKAPFPDSVIANLTTAAFYQGSWQQADSRSAPEMSAVAWYFARSLSAKTGIPQGMINLSIGGAPLETFVPLPALLASPEFRKKAVGNWLENPALPVWIRERGEQNVGSKAGVPSDENGKNHAYKPGFAFRAGVQPLAALPIAGILNYQGESNAQEWERVEEYTRLSKLLIDEYRSLWKDSLPYYFVQLSSIDSAKYNSRLWPQFRNLQRKSLEEISYSGMAVSSDHGALNDVHPTNKKDIGERLALWPLRDRYSLTKLPSGPLPVNAVYKPGKLIVRFIYSGPGKGLKVNRDTKGFSVNGISCGQLKWKKKKLIIPLSQKPQTVEYGWQPFSRGNFMNSRGLPGSTFQLRVE